jgi:hypothetical protein
MLDLLYIWARENLDYKYQQGMNEILAAIMSCTFSEIYCKEDLDDSDEEDELAPKRVFEQLHALSTVWSDTYSIFERLMSLGVKDLYYREF